MKATIRRALFGGISAPALADLGITVLRIVAGLSLAFGHGLGKIQGAGNPEGWIHTAPAALGFPMPTAFGWAAALTEFVGGICLALGLLTRWSALFILGVMCTALFLHHLPNGDAFSQYEKAVLFLAIALQFLFVGGGRFSVDRLIRQTV